MPATLRVPLTEAQRAELLAQSRDRRTATLTRERLEMLRLADAGWTVPRIAVFLHRHEQTVRKSVAALPDRPSGGRPRRITDTHLAAVETLLDTQTRTWTTPQGRRVNVVGALAPFSPAGPRLVWESRQAKHRRYDGVAHVRFVREVAAGLPAVLPAGLCRFRRCVVVVDNYAVHHAKVVQAAVPVLAPAGVEFFVLPPYSPELDLIQPTWRQVKYEQLPERSHPSGVPSRSRSRALWPATPAASSVYENLRLKCLVRSRACRGSLLQLFDGVNSRAERAGR